MKLTKSELVLLLLAILTIESCTPVKKLNFIQDIDKTSSNAYFNERFEKVIQPYDYLYIRIYSLDEKTNDVFNPRTYMSSLETELLSYTVDDKGNINFPFIGTVNVKGLTINQAKEKIESSLKLYLKNVSVIVRFVGNKITILGEVNYPGNHTFYDEKITIFQALGLAGGVNTYGNLSNVTLIREKDNNIKYNYLDLTKKNIVASDFYYLNPNDIIIISPIKAKYRGLKDYSLYLISTIISSASTLITLIYFINNQ